MPCYDMPCYEPEPLPNNPLKDGVVDRRPAMKPWERGETQAPSEVYVEPYNEVNDNDD